MISDVESRIQVQLAHTEVIFIIHEFDYMLDKLLRTHSYDAMLSVMQ